MVNIPVNEINSKPIAERNKILSKLGENGLTIRKLDRLTGVLRDDNK